MTPTFALTRTTLLRQVWPLLGLLLAAFASSPAVHAAEVKAQVVEVNGKKQVLLENAWVRLAINPAAGGRVAGFFVKQANREMITNKDAGLFLDHFYEQNWPGEMLYAPYEAELVSAGPTSAVVRLTRTFTGSWGGAANKGIAGIQVIRTLTLSADKPVLECDVELKNTDTHSKIFTYWQQHVYRADGDSGAESRQKMTRPSSNGLHVVRPFNDWTRGSELTAGWTAGIDPKDKVGLVFLMDYNTLWAQYNCGVSSSEYMFDKVLLPGGMSWKTHSSAMLVEGLESVVYASPRLVANIQVTANQGALSIEHAFVAQAPLTAVKVTTTLMSIDRKPIAGVQPSVSEGIAVSREPQAVKAEFPGMAGKPTIIQVTVEGNGWKESYEYAYAGATATTDYAPGDGRNVPNYTLPAPPKPVQIIQPPALTKVVNATPHILHLHGLYYRFWHVDDALATLGAHETTASSYRDIGDIQSLSVPPWDYSDIMTHDLIVFNNIAYGAMVGEQGAGMLKAYVENGGSVLFLGGPQAFGRGDYQDSGMLKALLPVQLTDAHDLHPLKKGTHLAVVGGSPLAGISWPKQSPVAMWMHQLAPKPGAEVWLHAGKQPAIVTQHLGKGRVAAVLLTPLGEPGRRETPYWDDANWQPIMTTLCRWLITGK